MKKRILVLAGVVMLTGKVFAQNVGIGTNNPQTKLQVVGAISSTPSSLPAAASVSIPSNTSVFLLTAVGGTQANAIGMSGPQEGQYLTIYNADDDVATFAGQTIAATGGVASFNYVNGGWRLTSNTKASGDLSGTYPNPTVAKIQGRDVSASTPNNGDVLKYNTGTGRYEPSPDLNSGGTGSVTSVSVTTANGVSGTVANPTTTPAISLTLGNITPSSVAATGTVSGTSLSTTGQVTSTMATGTPPFVVNSTTPVANLSIGGNAATATSATTAGTATNFTGSLAGDVTGTQSATTVGRIQGRTVSNAAPATNDVLKYNGTSWVPSPDVNSGGTVTSIATNNGITGGTITSTGTIGLTGNALAVHNVSSGVVAITGSGTAAGRTITGTTNQIDLTNGNGVSGNPTVAISPTYTAITKASTNLSGGGTVTYSGAANFSWTNRFIVIDNGNGSHFSTNGYFDISMPSNGTVINGYGGASNQTVAGGVINIPGWQALYYILPIGSGNGSVASNFVLASYTGALVIPETWILVAARNGDDNTLKLGTGVTLVLGQTYTATGGNVQGSGTTNYMPKFTSATTVGNSIAYENGSSIGIGTTAPAANTKLHVRSGRTYLSQLGNDPSSGYSVADLVLGDDVTTRNGHLGTNGSHIYLQSSDKSTITALDQGNDVGQISYQNLKWTIGESAGSWGAQNICFPRYTNALLSVDGSGNVNGRSIAVSGNGIGVTNGNGASGNPTLNLNYGPTMASPAGAGGWPVGNFGQYENHGTYTDFNVTPNYWGWNYMQGNTNGPTTQSSQWYRENISLGANYAGRGNGGYSLELAYPRDYQNNTGVWMRTVENGTINSWKRITGGDIVYVEDRTLRTYASNAGGGSGSVSVNTTPALAVVAGDIIHISTSFVFAFTGGSGNDDWWPIVNITGCASATKVLAADVENYDNDRNEFEPCSFDWMYVSPCTGNLQFNLTVNAESDADDGYKIQDVVVVATRH